jgi:class 3 adenylate cyclase
MSSKDKRELAAIIFADIVGFSSIMANDEGNALKLIKELDILIDSIINNYSGKIVKKLGDGYLLKFSSTVDAVKFSIEIQDSIEKNSQLINNAKLRMGIHLGDIVVDGDDVMGDGVNIASRVEAFAEPGGICMTQAVYQSIKSNLKIEVKDKGEVELKNIVDKYYLYKYPKIESETNINEEDSFDNNSLKISSIKKIPPINRGVINAFPPAIFLSIFMWFSLFIFINSIDFISSLISSNQIYGFTPFIEGTKELKVIFFLAIFYWIFMIFSSYRISCKDIKSVNSLIDYCVSEMGYGKKRQIGGTITYVCGFSKNLKGFLGKIDEISGHISVRIDGNVILVSGNWMYVNKLIKNLKALT